MTQSLRIQCVTIDALNPQLLADFWASALDWKVTEADEIGVVIELLDGSPAQGLIPDILFLKNEDKKAIKNRLHFDLRPSNQEVEVARLEALGARRVEIGQSEEAECTWIVMADPEGNEFCVLRERSS